MTYRELLMSFARTVADLSRYRYTKYGELIGIKPDTPCVEIIDVKIMRKIRKLVVAQTIGKRPKGAHLLHRCDNLKCVAVGHFLWGSVSDNMRDCILKGRHGRAKVPNIEQDLETAIHLLEALINGGEAAVQFLSNLQVRS